MTPANFPSNPPSPCRIAITGVGAVSPAGWGAEALVRATEAGLALPAQAVPRPPRSRPLLQRPIPPPPARPTWLAHPRLRRASIISHHAVAAALEALAQAGFAPLTASFPTRLAVVVCVMSGSVIYSRRFFDEVLQSPATASPVLFPETVYNAPSSHLAAVLGVDGPNYTLVGDPSVFVSALGQAGGWLCHDEIDAALVVGAEEPDWLTAEAWDLFAPGIPASGGSGALLLQPGNATSRVLLEASTERHGYIDARSRQAAIGNARQELHDLCGFSPEGLLVDGRSGASRYDQAEAATWQTWSGPVRSPKRLLGEAFAAGSAWQCVVAAEAVRQRSTPTAVVSVGGLNEAAAMASFRAPDAIPPIAV